MSNLIGIIESNETNIEVHIDNSGLRGRDGKSAYEIWLEQGNTGTEEDFLESLKEVDWNDITNRPIVPTTDYAVSRTNNMVTNGTGFMKTDDNFGSFIFDETEYAYAYGSFKDESFNIERTNDELIPVDATKTYRLSMYAKSSNSTSRYSIGVRFYDNDVEILGTNYILGTDFSLGTSWKFLESVISEELFPEGTAYIRLVFHNNQNVEGSVWYSNINFNLDFAMRGDIPTKLSQLELDIPIGAVSTINGISPDQLGEITLSASDIGAETPEGAQHKADTLITLSSTPPTGVFWFRKIN